MKYNYYFILSKDDDGKVSLERIKTKSRKEAFQTYDEHCFVLTRMEFFKLRNLLIRGYDKNDFRLLPDLNKEEAQLIGSFKLRCEKGVY